MNQEEFLNQLAKRRDFFNQEAQGFLDLFWPNSFFSSHLAKLKEASLYSFNSGGKRLRPTLVFLAGEALGVSPRVLMSWALAVELIHTYSLIHDDLPAMDNDTTRRGLPTNHIVFGETTALLAGDFLLTEAFRVVAESKLDSRVKVELIQSLSKNSGGFGMVGGQALDLKISKELSANPQNLERVHELKTAALIASAVEGVAVIAQVTEDKVHLWKQFGFYFGKCFQLRDDILDYQQKKEESSMVHEKGLEVTIQLLKEIEDNTYKILEALNCKDSQLAQFVAWNQKRDL